MTYSIRLMQYGDLDQVQDIDREAFPTQYPAPNYRQELTNKIARYIVLRDDTRRAERPREKPPPHRPAGRRRWWPWDKPRNTVARISANPTEDYIVGFSGIWLLVNEAHITNFAVREEYQGRGLGEYLLIATIELAGDLHAGALTLEVRVSNTVAQNLYAKYGFTGKGLRKGYYLDNREDALIMTTETINTEESRARLRGLRESLSARMTRRDNPAPG